MNERAVDVEPSLLPHEEAAKVEEPGDGALHDPAVPIASQFPPVLPAAPLPGLQVRHDQVDPAAPEPLPERARVVAPVRHDPLRLHARTARPSTWDRDLGEDALGEADLGHRGSFQANSER